PGGPPARGRRRPDLGRASSGYPLGQADQGRPHPSQQSDRQVHHPVASREEEGLIHGPFRLERSVRRAFAAEESGSCAGQFKARAIGNTIRGSARKLNLVATLIRGGKVEEALNILKFSPKGMAEDVRKVLASAVANAENNHNLDVDALVVAEASVGKSISMKRFATRARGRSARIVKPFSQLRVVVREQEEA